MKLPEREGHLLAILSFFYLIIRVPLAVILPLIRDEAVYAIMIEEQKSNLTLVPTFLGYFVSWKPPLFFWAYLPFTYLPLPLELSYRLPSILFGLLTIPLLFRLLGNAGVSRNLAFFSILFSLFALHSIYPNSTLLTDTLLFFLIVLSLCLYTEKKLPEQRFLAAALVAFLAFFVKFVVAFMIPVLAVIYFLGNDRSMLKKPLFIVSLLAVPLAFVLRLVILGQYGLAGEYQTDVGGQLVSGSVLGQFELFQTSFWALLVTGGMIWLCLAIFGFAKHWRENLFMSAWFLFSTIPLLSSAFLLWYYLPVIPAISYFAVKCLAIWKGKEKYDAIFYIVFSVFCFALLMFSAYIFWIIYDSFQAEREAGYLVSGKEGVLVIGHYTPSVIAYKTIPEMREGKNVDFGWIVFPDDMPAENITPFIDNYDYNEVPVMDGSFSQFFTKNAIFRKDTEITGFKYFVIAKAPEITLENMIFNKSNITVYAR